MRKPPVFPTKEANPPLILENTGIPTPPMARYVKTAPVPNLWPKIVPVRATPNV